jgi:hypothetical protein
MLAASDVSYVTEVMAMFQPRTAKIALFGIIVLSLGVVIGRFLPF